MRSLSMGIMLFSALSLVPVTMNAQDREHGQDSQRSDHKTYYDTAHKDQHEWNDGEDAAWSRYRSEHHVKQSDFAKASRKQQQNYWDWRHEHPDNH